METPGTSKMNKVILAKAVVLAFFGFCGMYSFAELPQLSAAVHEGVATCAASQCHGSAVPREGSNVLQNEYVTWTQNDSHSNAYATLSNDLSRAIVNRLGLKSAQTAEICLDCHADNVVDEKRGERFQISDGVGCEACHGGSENWLSTHYNVPTVNHEDNVAAGLYATNEAGARGDLCLSCHLGTKDKFATHSIMAAGHPRLSFELDTFTELWRTAGRQPHYQIDADYRDRKNAPTHSYTWAIGLLTDARHRMALLLDSNFVDNGMFPELGLYDCHACHRTMKGVQWQRLPRHGNAAIGEPFLNDGSLVMALAMVRAIAPDDASEFQLTMSQLHAAGSQNVTDLQAVARHMDDLLRKLQSNLSPDKIRNRADHVLQEILALGAAGNFLDYVSAEQAFMAVQLFAVELNDPDLEAALDDLATSLQDDERYRPQQFAQLLQRSVILK